MSRPDTWASSCPSTPRSSAWSSSRSRPWLQQTLARARAAADREGVRLPGRGHIQPRHRLPARRTQLPDQPVELGLGHFADRPGAHRGQRQPVTAGVTGRGQDRRDHEPGERPARAGHAHPDKGESGHQHDHRGRQPGHRRRPLGYPQRGTAHSPAPPGVPPAFRPWHDDSNQAGVTYVREPGYTERARRGSCSSGQRLCKESVRSRRRRNLAERAPGNIQGSVERSFDRSFGVRFIPS